MYGSGLRVLECVSLRVKDIDRDRREIVVRGGKGGKDRRTPLPERSVGPLRKWLAARNIAHRADRRFAPQLQITRHATYAVAAMLGTGTIGVENPVACCGARRAWVFQKQQLITTNAKPPIGQVCNLRWRQRVVTLPLIEQHKIIAQAMHFYEGKFHLRPLVDGQDRTPSVYRFKLIALRFEQMQNAAFTG